MRAHILYLSLPALYKRTDTHPAGWPRRFLVSVFMLGLPRSNKMQQQVRQQASRCNRRNVEGIEGSGQQIIARIFQQNDVFEPGGHEVGDARGNGVVLCQFEQAVDTKPGQAERQNPETPGRQDDGGNQGKKDDMGKAGQAAAEGSEQQRVGRGLVRRG